MGLKPSLSNKLPGLTLMQKASEPHFEEQDKLPIGIILARASSCPLSQSTSVCGWEPLAITLGPGHMAG